MTAEFVPVTAQTRGPLLDNKQVDALLLLRSRLRLNVKSHITLQNLTLQMNWLLSE